MFDYSQSQPDGGSSVIAVRPGATSVEISKSTPAAASHKAEGNVISRKSLGGDRAPRRNGWSYFIFRQDLCKLLHKGREQLISVGGTSFVLRPQRIECSATGEYRRRS